MWTNTIKGFHPTLPSIPLWHSFLITHPSATSPAASNPGARLDSQTNPRSTLCKTGCSEGPQRLVLPERQAVRLGSEHESTDRSRLQFLVLGPAKTGMHHIIVERPLGYGAR